jgi:hypothetical protein
MTLAAGTHLGSYEILAPLGAGGMGEVIGDCFSAFQWGVSRGDPPGGSPGRRGRVATAGRPPGAGPGGRGERKDPTL